MRRKSKAFLFVAALSFGAYAGMTVTSAQGPYSPIPEHMQLAQNKKQRSGIQNPCSLNGRVPCGQTCCTKNQRCGDGKCHNKNVTGGAKGAVGTQQTQ